MWIVYLILAIVVSAILLILGLNIYFYVLQKRTVTFIKQGGYTDTDPLLRGLNPTSPALIYFTNDMCTPCKTVQRPQLDKLQMMHPDLEIITVDTMQHPEIAQRWKVMSVPRTIVIGHHRHVHVVNMDVTYADTLDQQLTEAVHNPTAHVQIDQPAQHIFRLPKIMLGRPQTE